jgi:hypothetical protein
MRDQVYYYGFQISNDMPKDGIPFTRSRHLWYKR